MLQFVVILLGECYCVAMVIIPHAVSLFKPIAPTFLLRSLIQSGVRIVVVLVIAKPNLTRFTDHVHVAMWITLVLATLVSPL